MKTYNKLVRDKIPQILTEINKKHAYHMATDLEFETKLKEKLQEEVSEFLDDPCLEELADIHEVMLALLHRNGWTEDGLAKVRKKKLSRRGGFAQGYILEFTE